MGTDPLIKKMLVIGASGLVGGNLLRLSSRYPWVIVPVFHEYVPELYRERGLTLDISNTRAVHRGVEAVRPDCVVNLSCMGVAESETDPEGAHRVHVHGVKELACACKEHNIRLVHLSTDMVYSGDKGAPYTLRDEPDPNSVYGRTKLKGEEVIQETADKFVIVRSALVLGRGRFRKGGFLDWMVDKAEKKERLTLYADQLRTPMVVDDLVDVIFRLAESSFTGILLAGGDDACNRVELGEKLLSCLGVPLELIEPVHTTKQRNPVPLQRDLRLDNSRLKEIVSRDRFARIEDYLAGLLEKGTLVKKRKL